MVRIKVSLREIELLELSYKTMNVTQNYVIKDNFIVIDNNELENLETMFYCLLDTFVKIGLLPNSEPNELGLELDKLTEKVNHEYVRLNI